MSLLKKYPTEIEHILAKYPPEQKQVCGDAPAAPGTARNGIRLTH